MARLFQDTREKQKRGKAAPWYVGWYENGKPRSQKVGPKKEAAKVKAEIETRLNRKMNGMLSDVKWSDFVSEYEETIVPAMPSKRSQYEAKNVLKRFGEIAKPKYVGLIDKRTLDNFAAKRLRDPGKKNGDTLSAATVRKDLRTVLAALAIAAEWGYLSQVPKIPNVKGFEDEKRFVSAEHFEAMLAALKSDDCPVYLPEPAGHEGMNCPPADWWRALLVFLWITGMRIGATLELRWQDVDLEAGEAISRARHNKQKKDCRIAIAAAVDVLRAIQGFSKNVFPWEYDRTTLANHFERLQEAARIHLPCSGADRHECTPKCNVYGFHDFRRAHATYNYGRVGDRDLQEQMGHSSFETTKRYIKFAEDHQRKAYDVFLPAAISKKSAIG